MKIVLVTGSAGLIGGEAVEFFSSRFDLVIGIDNNMRRYFFGEEGSTHWNTTRLLGKIPNYKQESLDIRDYKSLETIFLTYKSDIDLIIHAAAQPSHDWAAKEPFVDYNINATGTLNMLELFRQNCPKATFIFTSTNKVYGDIPNSLPLKELDSRWEIDPSHPYFEKGIDEKMSIDQTKHSLFGASKLAADILVQEYGRYFGLNTGIFRGGCLTGPNHSGAPLHGFLSYLMKCACTGRHYSVLGYKGKQVRDNIHSFDLINMFWHFYQSPRKGEVYNAGGGRSASCSIIEAIAQCELITSKKINHSYSESNRIGDHIWWISDVSKFKMDYPGWNYKFDLSSILQQLFESNSKSN